MLAEFGRNVSDRYFVVFLSISETIEMSDVDHINILFAIGVNLMLQTEREKIKIPEATRNPSYLAFHFLDFVSQSGASTYNTLNQNVMQINVRIGVYC
ncbi:MAG: hypothetical protein KME43_10535 [Myxacorys chilensis ATA2-1-KO14]|nr:hypothetical protein [Myxacorys chilensis ATA2-1-KO14]